MHSFLYDKKVVLSLLNKQSYLKNHILVIGFCFCYDLFYLDDYLFSVIIFIKLSFVFLLSAVLKYRSNKIFKSNNINILYSNSPIKLIQSIYFNNNFFIPMDFILTANDKYLGMEIYGIKVLDVTKMSDFKLDDVNIFCMSRDKSSISYLCNIITIESFLINSIDWLSNADFLKKILSGTYLTDFKKIDLKSNSILISGGAGSIGSSIVRQLLMNSAAAIVVVDLNEFAIYNLEIELGSEFDLTKRSINFVVADVSDMTSMTLMFDKFKFDRVFHAAALKHVPQSELNPKSTINTNIVGTYNLLECATRHAVQSFTLVSTDKAVRPTNIMGASKRIAEKLVLAYSVSSGLNYNCVRFGNVIGSSGSVLPFFLNSLAHGKNLALTSSEITRFFMTIPQASFLVIRSSMMNENGCVFLLDMGSPLNINDIADNVLRFFRIKFP